MNANEIISANCKDWQRRIDAKCFRYNMPRHLGDDILQDVLCVLVLKNNGEQIIKMATTPAGGCTLLDIYVSRTIRFVSANRARSYRRSLAKTVSLDTINPQLRAII